MCIRDSGIGAAGISSYSLFVSGNTYLKGATSGSSDYALVIQNSSATNLFLVRNDGAATFSGSIAIGNTVTASVNNLVTNKVAIVINGTQYYLLASTSSI